jgi:protein required for attachment to host cells
MNMNSLIIVVDASRARLFRTAHASIAETSLELIEIEALEYPEARAEPGGTPASEGAPRDAVDRGEAQSDGLRGFARRIAVRAALFARYHFCNPVIVAAPQAIAASLLTEIERELPQVYVRLVSGEVAELPERELLRELQNRSVFTAAQYPCRA